MFVSYTKEEDSNKIYRLFHAELFKQDAVFKGSDCITLILMLRVFS